LSDPEKARDLAEKHGLFVVTQDGQSLKIGNQNVLEYKLGKEYKQQGKKYGPKYT